MSGWQVHISTHGGRAEVVYESGTTLVPHIRPYVRLHLERDGGDRYDFTFTLTQWEQIRRIAEGGGDATLEAQA